MAERQKKAKELERQRIEKTQYSQNQKQRTTNSNKKTEEEENRKLPDNKPDDKPAPDGKPDKRRGLRSRNKLDYFGNNVMETQVTPSKELREISPEY